MAWRRRAFTLMDDTSAAWGFSPTARTSRPQRVRYTSHQASGTSGYSRYSGHGWPNSAGPSSGISTSPGISKTCAVAVSGLRLLFRKLARPSTRMLSVNPTTNWLAVRLWLKWA